MPFEFGLADGLAQNFQGEQRLNDMRYQHHALKAAQNEAQAKIKILSDDLQFNNALNSHDRPLIEEEAKKTIYDIGKYDRDNPDWRYNVTKSAQMKQLVNSLKTNENFVRGVASDTAYKNYLTDLQEVAKSPNSHNQHAYDSVGEQWNNYLKYGNQLGEEAASKQGRRAFVYNKPQDFIDISKKGQELGNSFKDVKPVALKNGRSGAWETVVNEKSLDRDALAFYQEHKEQFDQQHPNNPLQAAKDFIKSGIKTDFNWGDTHLQDELILQRNNHAVELEKLKSKAKEGQGVDYYVETILKPGRTADAPERLDATFGSKIKHYIVNDSGDPNSAIDNTGAVFNYNGDIADKDFNETGKYSKTGIKRVSGYVYKPVQWALEKGILNDPFEWGGSSDKPETDYKIDGNWKKTASWVDVPGSKEGETVKMIKINVTADVDGRSPGYQGKYNSLVATTDQRNGTNFGQEETYQGHPIGSVVNTTDGSYLVTKEGYVKQ